MSDLNRLSPPALKAALTGGTASWGQWGSADHHTLYVEPFGAEYPMRKRRMCRCGCRRKVTHRVAANGVALASGCELGARRIAAELKRMGTRRALLESAPEA